MNTNGQNCQVFENLSILVLLDFKWPAMEYIFFLQRRYFLYSRVFGRCCHDTSGTVVVAECRGMYTTRTTAVPE